METIWPVLAGYGYAGRAQHADPEERSTAIDVLSKK
jgi:hypothetical protein